MLTNKNKNLIKREIIKALIAEKGGIFFKCSFNGEYVQVFNGTNMDMVMDRVLIGLNSAQKILKESK